jgi:hypothetical protein
LRLTQTVCQGYISCMEPAEKVAHVIVKVAFIVFALIISVVFDEFGHGVAGFLVFIVGLVIGMLALTVWKTL